MDIIFRERCNSYKPYHVMLAQSDTTSGVLYTITVCMPGDERKDWICSCPSWAFRGGYCKHLDRVDPCYWKEGDPEIQVDEGICPRCGGPTHEELELIDGNQ